MDNMKKWNSVPQNKKTITENYDWAKAQNNDRAKVKKNDKAKIQNNPPQFKGFGQYQKLASCSYALGKEQQLHLPPQHSEDGKKIGLSYQQYLKSTVPDDDRYQSSWHKEQKNFANILKWPNIKYEARDAAIGDTRCKTPYETDLGFETNGSGMVKTQNVSSNLKLNTGSFLKQHHDGPQSVGPTKDYTKKNIVPFKTFGLSPQTQNGGTHIPTPTNVAGATRPLDVPKWECNTDPSKNTSRKGLGSQSQDGFPNMSQKLQSANNLLPTEDNEQTEYHKTKIDDKSEPRNTWIALKKDDEIFPDDTLLLDENNTPDSTYLTEVWIHKNTQTQELYYELPNNRRIIQQITKDGQSLVHKSVKDDVKLTKQILDLEDIPKTNEERQRYRNLQIVVLDHAQKKFIYPDVNFTPELNMSNIENKPEPQNDENPIMPNDVITQLPKPETLHSIKNRDPSTLGKLDELKAMYLMIYKVRETQITMANIMAAAKNYDQNYHATISTLKNTDEQLKNILNDLTDMKKKQTLDETEDYIEVPNFGDQDMINMKDIQALPTFDGENNGTTLHQFWQKMIQFIETQKISEKATKMILAHKLLGTAFDVFEMNKDKTTETIIKQLRDRYGSFPTKLDFEEQMNSFKREPDETIKACMNRFEYIVKKLYKNEPDYKQILEMNCKEMIRKLAIPEVRQHLDRAMILAKSQGQELDYKGKLNMAHREEELIKKNKKPNYEANSLDAQHYNDYDSASEDEVNFFENEESNIANLDVQEGRQNYHTEDEEDVNSDEEHACHECADEENQIDEQHFIQEHNFQPREEYDNNEPEINIAEKWEKQIAEAFEIAHTIVEMMQNTHEEGDIIHKIVDILMEKTWTNW